MRRAWRMIKRILKGLGFAVLALFLVLVINTFRQGRATLAAAPTPPKDAIDAVRVAGHLAQALRFKTISHEDPKNDDYAELTVCARSSRRRTQRCTRR